MIYFCFLFIISRFVNPKKEYPKLSKFYYYNLVTVIRIIFWFTRTKVTVTGMDKVPEGKCLFVSNHRSNFDPMLVLAKFSKNLPGFVSKEGNFHIPIFGRMLHKCCFLTIDRENPRQSLMCLMKAADRIKDDQCSIGIYPEGTRNTHFEEGLLPFHNGVFKIAKMAKVPVVVLSVAGTENIHKNFPRRGTDIKLNVAGVISTEEVCSQKTEEISNTARKLIFNDLYPGKTDIPVLVEA